MIEAKEAFFKDLANQHLAVTFDDVGLEPHDAFDHEVTADTVSLETRFTRNVGLKVPLVSAAMDTVTTSDMAIAMAKLGGLGVIHAGLSIEDQREEVRRVKKHLNGLIETPICVKDSDTLESVLNMRKARKFDFHTFPVTNNEGRFVGLLTSNDFEFPEDITDSVGNAMTSTNDVISAPAGTSIVEAYNLMRDSKKKTVPLLDDQGAIAGLYVWKDVKRIVRDNSGLYNVDRQGRLIVAFAVTTHPEALDRVRAVRKHADVVVVDSARGDSSFSLKTFENIKAEFEDLDVMVGNISTKLSASRLGDAQVDGLKVGQGPGRICTTRVETGIGVPQVSAIYQCAKAVEKHGTPICADGGIEKNADISIAIAAGAHSVMMGSGLAGAEEAPGEVFIDDDGTQVKYVRGMGSSPAIEESRASRVRYGGGRGKPLPEGIEAVVPYVGRLAEYGQVMLGYLRQSFTYTNSPDIESHRQNAVLFRVTPAGRAEAGPHGVKPIAFRERVRQ